MTPRVFSASTGELKILLPAVFKVPRFFTKNNLQSVLTVKQRPQPPLGLGKISWKERKKRKNPSQIFESNLGLQL